MLGLKPTGVETLPEAPMSQGLAERLEARHALRLETPPYDPVRDAETRILLVVPVRHRRRGRIGYGYRISAEIVQNSAYWTEYQRLSMKLLIPVFLFLTLMRTAPAAEPVQLQSRFDIDAVRWVKTRGNSSINGQAFLRLADGRWKGCAGFGVELLPVAAYSSERIFRTYGNNVRGQILLEQNPPKFTPDAEEYHEMVLFSRCGESDHFEFKDVPAGEFYVMAFIIWNAGEGATATKSGGAAMTRVSVTPDSKIQVLLRIEP